jgi:DNA-binding beta-propeller fold protein YncE
MTRSRSRAITEAARSRAHAFLVAAVVIAALVGASTVAYATINNGEPAVDILGEFNSPSTDTTADYVKGCVNNGASSIGFNLNTSNGAWSGSVIDPTYHRLFVADGGNNRVLVFTLNSSTNLLSSKTPAHVLGQANFITCGAALTQAGMSNPSGLGYDSANNRLYVADNGNDRILVFSVSTITNGMNASYVLGPSNFTSIGDSCAQAGVGPLGLAFDATNNRLFAVNPDCNDVYVYNTSSLSNGMNAAYVLGATGFGGTGGPGGATQSTLTLPFGVAFDTANQLLYVGDNNNSRVMVFNVAPGTIMNGENASYVLGQPSFTANGANLTQSGMESTTGLAFDSVNDRLFVADGGYSRVTIYPTASTGGPLNGNGENASDVLGQISFITNNGATPQSGLYEPTGVTYDSTNNQVYVSDSDNNRVMLFSTVLSTPTPTVTTQSGADACVIASGGLYCWGSNGNGEDGQGNTEQYEYLSPLQVGTATNWTAISQGDPDIDAAACGIAGGKLYCWGDNYYGELGNGTTSYAAVTTPTQVGSLTTWTAISTSGYDTCGIAGGKLYCWGVNGAGEDGQGNTTQYLTPTQVGTATNWIAVSTGGWDTCGIRGSSGGGALYCWGWNGYGEDGNAATATAFVTSGTYNGNLGGVTGANTDCQNASTATGTLAPAATYYAWISDGTNSPSTTFTQSTVPYVDVKGNIIASNWTALVSGSPLSYGIEYSPTGATESGDDVWTAVTATGTASSGTSATTNCSAWTTSATGSSHKGDVGLSNQTGATWTVDTSVNCSSSERLYCFEQPGGPVQQNSPVQVGTATNWSAVSQGGNDTCGIAGGALYCWGWNNYGEDGLGNTTQYNAPQQVGSSTNWTTISIQNNGGIYDAAADACGINNGALYCWGQNAYGEDGQSNTTQYETPQQVGSATNWTAISYGISDTCGIVGSVLYCWGYNGYSEDGLGNYTQYTTPQAVTSTGTTGENASDEIGQYTSPSSTATVSWTQWGYNNGPTALGFVVPADVALDPVNHQLFVSDAGNFRVLVYALNTDNSIPTASGGHTASYVIGQPNFSTGNGCLFYQFSLCSPQGLAVDTVNNRLFVSDYNNNRVLVYSTPITSNGPNAIGVLGMTTYTYVGGSTTQSTFNAPTDVAYDSVNQNLYVADTGNNRVLVFNVPPGFSIGENASYEFGQPSGGSEFTTYTAATSQSGLSFPSALAYDPVNHRLFVADSYNSRIMVFSTASLSDGPNATNVIGQASFTAATAASSQTGLNGPIGVAYDTNTSRLFVANGTAGDILVYNAGPSVLPVYSASASFVLGTTSFTGAAASTTQSGLNLCAGYCLGLVNNYLSSLRYDPGSGRLFVSDSANNRIMIFDASTISTPSQWNFIPGYE